MGKPKRPKPTHPMMDKPEWLQRFEDPDNMTIKERKKWEEEAELRAKLHADAETFEIFIKEQRDKMQYEDEYSRKSGIFGRAVEDRMNKQREDFLGVLRSSSVVFSDQNQTLMDAGSNEHQRSIASHTPSAPTPLYTAKRRGIVEDILKRSHELSATVAKKIEQQYPLQKMEQNKKNALSRVKNAEQSLNLYLEQLKKSSKSNIEHHSNVLQSKYELFELPKLHKQVAGEYAREIHTLTSTYKNVTYQNNIDLRAAQQEYRENRPDWLVHMGEAREYVRQNGYNNNLKWRSKTVKVLMELKAHLNTLPGHFGTKLSVDIQQMCKNINLLSNEQAVIKLETFTERAIRICSKFNPKYESVRSTLISVTDRVRKENSHAENLLKGKKQKFMAHHNNIIKRIAKARHHLQQQGIIDHAEGAFQANGWRGLTLRKSLVQYDLMVVNRMSCERNDREKLRSYFYNMLLQCANAGAWQESLYIYAAMLGCRVPPECKTFKYIFMACKNALPPQSKRTLLMIKEMTRLGLHGDRNLYHVAFSACAMAGDHRRTGQIFKIMIADGVKPSSGTYDLIVKTVSKYCKAEDSAEIYDSLKLSGVPERIAYVAAFKAGSRYVSRLEETTAKYYKLDSREQKIFEKTWRTKSD